MIIVSLSLSLLIMIFQFTTRISYKLWICRNLLRNRDKFFFQYILIRVLSEYYIHIILVSKFKLFEVVLYFVFLTLFRLYQSSLGFW